MSLCILIPALVGIISGILGYLLGKMNSNSGDNSASLSLQSDLDACSKTPPRQLSADTPPMEWNFLCLTYIPISYSK
jgi:hypothetical protein